MFNILFLLLVQVNVDICDCGLSARAFAADTLMCRPRWFISYAAETPDPFDRASMRLLELADSFYYASCDTTLSVVCQRETRKAAYAMYEACLETYPNSHAEPFVKTATAWRLLEQGMYNEASRIFKEIFETTEDKDLQVVAAYSKGLCDFYRGNYEDAFTWLLDTDGYRKILKIAVDKDDEDTQAGILYNETADSLIDKALLLKAEAAERLHWWADALANYRKVTDDYYNRLSADLAWYRIVDFYLRAKDIEKAMAATDDLRGGRNPGDKETYRYALALMYDYMLNSQKDTVKAEEYKQALIMLNGLDNSGKSRYSDEFIEKRYQDIAMSFTDTPDIDELIEVTNRLRNFNPQSKYLPRPIVLLGLLLLEAERYDEANSVLAEVKNFPDATATLDLLPVVEFHLARIHYKRDEYAGAALSLKDWLKNYEDNKEVDPELKTSIYWFLALSCFQCGEIETNPEKRTRLYEMTFEALRILKERYSETTIYNACYESEVRNFDGLFEVYPR